MSATPPSKPRPAPGYVLRLRPLATGWRVPPEQRLRALLKASLRGYGFVCVGCRPDTAPPGQSTANDLAPPVPQEPLERPARCPDMVETALPPGNRKARRSEATGRG